MNTERDDMSPQDGAPVPAGDIPAAVTAHRLVYSDGATQTFSSDGTTRYVEGGRETEGTWSVDDTGHFCSFWPPSYRAAYDLRWIVEGGEPVGLRFSELRSGSRFEGRYQ